MDDGKACQGTVHAWVRTCVRTGARATPMFGSKEMIGNAENWS